MREKGSTNLVIFFIVIIIGFFVGWYFLFFQKNNLIQPIVTTSPQPTIISTPVNQPETKVYRNYLFSYTFTYPASYTIDDSLHSGSDVTLLISKDIQNLHEELLSIIRARILSYTTKEATNNNIENIIVEKLKSECLADGPGSSIYCDQLTKIVPFINPNKKEGYEIYLRQVHKASGKISYQTKGPLFAFYGLKEGLILALDVGYGFPNNEEESDLRKIVETLQF